MAELRYFAVILFYLLFVSALFTAIINDKEGVNLKSVDIANSYKTTDYQDFTANGTYFIDNIEIVGFFTNGWEKQDIGYVKITDTSLLDEPLVFKNIIPIDNTYYVIYYINNSIQQPFSIYPQFIQNHNMFEVYLDETGYHVPNYLLVLGYLVNLGDKYFIPNEYLMTETEFILKTEFEIKDMDNSIIRIYDEDDNLILEAPNIIYEGSSGVYAGVLSRNAGFIIEKLYARTQNFNPDEATGIQYAFDYIFSMLKIIFWSVDEAYLPLVFNLLIVKFPLALAIMFLIMIIRGV